MPLTMEVDRHIQRTHYRNGQEIGLDWNGCDGCTPTMIQGVFCHEHGCEFGWKDKQRDCFACGFPFFPEYQHQVTCSDCLYDEEVSNG